jgi:Flp pilus assembly protein TadG
MVWRPPRFRDTWLPRLGHRWRRAARRLIRRERGNPAIEFARVAGPLLLLVSGTLETAMILFSGAVLDGSALDAARQIRTGQAQATANLLQTFKDQLCSSRMGDVDCAQIVFDVRSYTNFASATLPPLYDQNGQPLATSFSPGNSGQIVVVRAAYLWSYMTPFVSQAYGHSTQQITSTVVFRNEPFAPPS